MVKKEKNRHKKKRNDFELMESVARVVFFVNKSEKLPESLLQQLIESSIFDTFEEYIKFEMKTENTNTILMSANYNSFEELQE